MAYEAEKPVDDMTRREREKFRAHRLAKFWERRIIAGIKAKETYKEMGDEVLEYFRAQHRTLFDSPSVREHFMRFEGAAAVSVPKAAQIRNSLGPHLYLSNPRRVVTPTTQNGVLIGLSRVLEAYINYTPRETRLVHEVRKAIDDALLRGRGFLFTGYDSQREVICSKYVSSNRVVIDPDVDSLEDAEWIAIKYEEPYFRTERRVRQKWRLRGLDSSILGSGGTTQTEYGEDLSTEDKDEDRVDAARTNDTVPYWVVYSKMGKGWRGSDMGDEDPQRFNDSADFFRVEIVLGHDYPLSMGGWEIPLHLDADWPIAAIDLVETPDQLWPVSLMSQVLPLQKAMDLLTSLLLNSCKMRGKFLLFVDASLDVHNIQRIKVGGPAECIPVKLQPGQSLRDVIMVMDPGVLTPELAREREFLERQFEATTGVGPMLHGAAGPAPKERSATASQIRSDAVSARVSNMRQRVEEWSSTAARHEALMVRLELDEEEVARYVKPDDVAMYYVRVNLPGDIPLSVRDRRTEDEKRRDREEGREEPITLEYIYPAAATYFLERDQALEAAVELSRAMGESTDPRVLEIYALAGIAETMDEEAKQEHLAQGGNPEATLPEGIEVDVVSAEMVWRDTAGMTAKELMREFAYEIATGSMQKLDKQRELDLVRDELQQVLPIALQTANYEIVNEIMRHRADAYEIPPDMRLPEFAAPPAPPPEAAPPTP